MEKKGKRKNFEKKSEDESCLKLPELSRNHVFGSCHGRTDNRTTSQKQGATKKPVFVCGNMPGRKTDETNELLSFVTVEVTWSAFFVVTQVCVALRFEGKN